MNHKLLSIICMTLCTGCVGMGGLLSGCSRRETPDAGPSSQAEAVMQGYLDHPETFPFSFVYEGTEYRGFGSGFEEVERESTAESNALRTTVTFLHTQSGAHFTLDTRSYAKYGAFEWVITVQNRSDHNTGVFSDLKAADLIFQGASPCVKGISGDLGDLYAPYETPLREGDSFRRTSVSGRPTHGTFPYFNFEYGDGGSFVAIGWPGTWYADFTAISGDETRLTCGQGEIRTFLAPGESIRTPLVAFLQYNGREEASNMNLWRRWFIDCNMRKVRPAEDAEPELFPPVFGTLILSQGQRESSFLRTVRSYQEHGLPLDYYWIDAGWYTNCEGKACSWPETGTWNIDRERFPTALRQVSEEMAKTGGKTVLWFEPEVLRLNKEEFLASEPGFDASWMLGTAMAGTWLEGQLLDLGNAGFRDWLFERVCRAIDEGGISLYRQDFNVDPAPVWAQCDEAAEGERKGFTENRYVCGYLAFWDRLIERYPDMMIDSCASGGGRNDLETLRRALPLHCSDFWDGNLGGYNEKQATLQSLLAWFPYFKLDQQAGAPLDLYHLRSCYAPWFNLNESVMKKDFPWELVRQAHQEWEQVSRYMYADFYPLTPYSKASDVWRGWEFYDASCGEGYLQLFRAEESAQETLTVCLYGLDPDASYCLTDADGGPDITGTGKELMEQGFRFTLPEAGSSALLFIHTA